MATPVKRKDLTQLYFEIPEVYEDLVCECLFAATGVPPITLSTPEVPVSKISYFEDKDQGNFSEIESSVGSVLHTLVQEGVLPELPRLVKCLVPHENWAESWKKNFKPILIGKKLWVLPPWSIKTLEKGQSAVILNPGLSFGTGQHPTTRFCLQKLVANRQPQTEQSMLDLGSGSGILSIAAAKLGYGPIRAIDHDPESVAIAQNNAKENRVDGSILFEHKDLSDLPKKPKRQYDVVCANLMDSLLIQEKDRILAFLKPTGTLILAGILFNQFPQVLQTYQEKGMKILSSRKEKEWKSMALGF